MRLPCRYGYQDTVNHGEEFVNDLITAMIQGIAENAGLRSSPADITWVAHSACADVTAGVTEGASICQHTPACASIYQHIQCASMRQPACHQHPLVCATGTHLLTHLSVLLVPTCLPTCRCYWHPLAYPLVGATGTHLLTHLSVLLAPTCM